MRAQKADQVDEDLGRRIFTARVERNITSTGLGHWIGVSPQQISKYELGQSRVPVSRLLQICHCLDVPVAELLAGLPGANGRANSPDERRSSSPGRRTR